LAWPCEIESVLAGRAVIARQSLRQLSAIEAERFR
jgi:hypothetical protein